MILGRMFPDCSDIDAKPKAPTQGIYIYVGMVHNSMVDARMVSAGRNVLKFVMGLEADERVFIVTDKACSEVADVFAEAAKAMKANSVATYLIKEADRPLKTVPDDLLGAVEAMKRDGRSAMILNTISSKPEETPFRLQLLKTEISPTTKVGHAPGISRAMFTEGPMTADYEAMLQKAKSLINKMKGAVSVHIATKKGTDLKFNIRDRAFETDAQICTGAYGNLPAGEVWCAPEEESAEGTLVVDGSIGDMGPPPSPVTLFFSKGKAKRTECKDKAFNERLTGFIRLDEMSDVIGEFGIGLNEGARAMAVTMLEAEKAARTIHIACGNNLKMAGGKNDSKTHRDFLVMDPTVLVTFKDGKKRQMLKNGVLVL